MAASKPITQPSLPSDFLDDTESTSGTLAVGLGCFPLDDGRWRPPSVPWRIPLHPSTFHGNQYSVKSPLPIGALQTRGYDQDAAYTAFAENQLSPRLIGLSPLATTHQMLLQQQPVRSSTPLSRRFHLVMASSRGFGSLTGDRRALRPFAFATRPPPSAYASPPHENSQSHDTKGTRSRREDAFASPHAPAEPRLGRHSSVPSQYLFTVGHGDGRCPWRKGPPSSHDLAHGSWYFWANTGLLRQYSRYLG